MLDLQTISGLSAKCIVAHLTGIEPATGDYPHDADDFGRCEAVLDGRPDLRADLPKMAELNAYWAALVPRWEEIRASDDRTAAIKAVVGPIEAADPGHVRIGDHASMRIGRSITYKGEAKSSETRMKETDADRAVREKAFSVAGDELRQFIERYEQLEAEKKDVAEQQKELMAEAKGRGYDTKVMKKVVALRKRKPDDVAEEQAVLGMYLSALGMA